MQELSARAALVSAPEVTDGLTASVTREEVAEALRVADTPPELILDVTRFANGDPAETRNLVVAWERGDLEELLRQTEGEQVVLTFDREAIRQAMEADVEAHGIREKALVLAVAAMAATGAAANASAQTSPDDRAVSQATSVGQVEIPYLSHGTLTPEGAAGGASVSPDDRAVSQATSVGQAEIPYLSHGTLTPEGAAAGASAGPDDRSVSMAAPATASASEAIAADASLSPDDRAVSMASEAIAADASVSPDDRAVSMAAPEPGSASESIAAEIPYLSHGTLTPEAAAAGASASPDDRAFSMAAPAPTEVASADSGISISAPDAATTAGIGAAIALAITGAGFVVAGRRRVTPAS
jgi:hypothetical protein